YVTFMCWGCCKSSTSQDQGSQFYSISKLNKHLMAMSGHDPPNDVEGNKTRHQVFCKVNRVYPSPPSHDVDEDQRVTENKLTIALNFEAYLCTQIKPLYCHNGHTYCECCDDVNSHEVFSGHAVLDELVASRKERFIKRPTNTFGQFETPCSNVMAEFVRMTDDTRMEDLEKLFFHIWRLRKPGLVLSLHGSLPVGKAFQRRCYGLIFGVFQKTPYDITLRSHEQLFIHDLTWPGPAVTWIITDGQYGSVSEVMSLGMCSYAEAYRLKSQQVIGIVPWRRLPFQSHLRSSNYMGSTQVEFPQRGPKTELHTPLAPYHTRYLFVDSGPKNDIHCIQGFRTRLEAWLSTMTFCPNSCDLIYNTPVCGILVAGRPEDALGVCEALKCNIPFVVVADSGGLASIIDQYLSETKYMRELSQPYTNEANGILEADHERLLEIMMRYWPEATLGEDLTALVTTIIGWSHLMQFFFAESDSDASLDGKIVSALINPGNIRMREVVVEALFQDANKKQSWKPRLNLAMELNKTDIVLEGILDESPWTLEEISPFVKCCLLANKPRFLRLFCDAGLQMYEFADQKTVEELFTIEARSNTVEGRALKQFFLDHIHKMPSNITVGVAKHTLKIMMGRKYFTHAVCSDRRSRHVMWKSKEASLNQQAEATVRSPYLHENESYLQYLYLWALASKRYEIARYLLMMLTDITAAALFGASFLRRKARIARSPTEIEELHYYSLVFENIALSILNQCYSSNAESTMQLLIMERQTFEQLSCFVIAAEGNCKHFMEHQACQEYLDRVWARTLLVRDISIKFFFSLFVGIVCPPAIPFIADYDESKYALKYSGNVDDVAYTVLFCLAAFNLQFEFTFANYSWMAVELTTIIMTTAHFIDHVKNALTNWASCRDFIGQRINQFSLVAFAFYAVGVSLQVIFTLSTRGSFGFEQFSRISLAFGATIALQQLLRLLSIHHYIGPKLQMIRKMVVRDLVPFLVIVLIFWSMYAIIFSVLIQRPSDSRDASGALSRLLRIMRSGFFQMFGEFNLEELLQHYGSSACGNVTTSGCTYPHFEFLLPTLLSLFVLTTHVLLINLLIATFTKTYDDMEAESLQLWTMQRYVLMDSILSQSVVPATLSIFPLIYQCFQRGFRRLSSSHVRRDSFKHKPFQKSFRSSPTRERQLINWEKLNALIVTMGENYNEGMVEKRSVERSSRGPTRVHQEGHWHLLHRLRPADIRTGHKKTMLEQKIENIDEALESIMAFWQNHQVAFYATLTSDITPRSLDPPIPWDVPFPEYSPIQWQPSSHQIPAWEITIGEISLSTSETSRAPCRLLEVDTTAMTTGSKTAPQNPEGRVGIAGKGLLPQIGGNSACIVAVERCGFNDTEEVLLLRGIRAQAQFPWFLYQHGRDCSQISCYKELVRGFCEQIVEVGRKSEVIDPAALQRFVATYNEHRYVGPVSDPINCDNAWLEVTVVHFRITSPFPFIRDVEENHVEIELYVPEYSSTLIVPFARFSKSKEEWQRGQGLMIYRP
ncbi:Transient receptor potential cation channel subfamily M member 8, partial [Taenia solium]